MSQTRVLIVEDDNALREALSDTLQLAGYEVLEANGGDEALEIFRQHRIGMVVSDVQMEGMDGHSLLKRIKSEAPETPMVLMTAYGTIQKAVEAMQDGAADYLVKPFEAEVLVNMVSCFVRPESHEDSELIAKDPRTLEVQALAHKVADSDATILISGESGTGKEVFAREIHRRSPRGEGPFVALNCAAIPENMLEAMLFGYEKGAFTGAYKASPGKFEQANGGTLLLDEISEMELGLQAKLLRVLQEREVERLGGNKVIPLDVRVLATTNRDMRKEVAEGRFREDLYYRLNVFPLHLPPLRERPADVVAIAHALLRRHCEGQGKAVPVLTTAAETKLAGHSWPGNVRELDNVVQRALILQANGTVDADEIMFEAESVAQAAVATVPAAVAEEQADGGQLGESLKAREHRLILEALEASGGNRKSASERLGISQRTLRYKLARMREEGYRVPGAYGIEQGE